MNSKNKFSDGSYSPCLPRSSRSKATVLITLSVGLEDDPEMDGRRWCPAMQSVDGGGLLPDRDKIKTITSGRWKEQTITKSASCIIYESWQHHTLPIKVCCVLAQHLLPSKKRERPVSFQPRCTDRYHACVQAQACKLHKSESEQGEPSKYPHLTGLDEGV